MARITTTAGPELQAGTVATAGVTIQPTVLGEVIKTITPAIKASAAARSKRDALNAQDQAARTILDSMNTFTQDTISRIGEDFTPAQAQIAITSEMQNKLANTPALPVDQWSKVTSQVNSTMSFIGKQHFFDADGQNYVLNGATGEVTEINGPEINPDEELAKNLLASLPKGIVGYSQLIAATNPSAAKKYVEEMVAINANAERASMEAKVSDLQAKRAGLSESDRKRFIPSNRASLTNDFVDKLMNRGLDTTLTFLEADPTASPDEAFQAWEDAAFTWVSEPNRFGVIQGAGFTDTAEFWNKLEPYRTAVQNRMDVASRFKDDKQKVEAANLRVGMTTAAFQEQMSDDELVLWTSADKLTNLATNASFLKSMVGLEGFKKMYPTASAVSNAMIQSERQAEAQTKVAQVGITRDITPTQYVEWVKQLSGQVNVALNPDKSPNALMSFNIGYVDTLAELVTEHPMWEIVKRDQPEVAGNLEKSIERIRKNK